MGSALTNQNSNQEEIKSRLKSKYLKIKIYVQNNNFAFVLCGYETWLLTLKEEHRLRVFENGVLRRIFEPKRDEVTGDWRKIHKENLYNLYSSPKKQVIKLRRMRWTGHVACMGDRGGAYRILVGKPE